MYLGGEVVVYRAALTICRHHNPGIKRKLVGKKRVDLASNEEEVPPRRMVPVALRGGHEGTTEDDVIHWGKSMLKADANSKRFEKK